MQKPNPTFKAFFLLDFPADGAVGPQAAGIQSLTELLEASSLMSVFW